MADVSPSSTGDSASRRATTSAQLSPTARPEQGRLTKAAAMAATDKPVHACQTPTAEAAKDLSQEVSVACGPEGCKPGSIFVSVAAYRDPECQWTMRDLFRQAGEPELVTVGVVWQIDAVADAPFVRVAGNTQRHRQVRSLLVFMCIA